MANEYENEKFLEILKKKAQIHLEQNIPAHLSFVGGGWNNGFITQISPDFFMFNDREDGMMPVFFIDLIDIKPLAPPKEKRNKA